MKYFLLTLLSTLSFNLTFTQHLEWVVDYPGGSNTNYEEIALKVDNANNLYTFGSFSSGTDLDPSPNLDFHSSIGSTDIFIQKLDEHKNFLWASTFSGLGEDVIGSILVDDSNNVYVSGTFGFDIAYNYGNNQSFNATSNGSDDIFVCKLDAFGNLIWAKTFGGAGNDDIDAMSIDSKGNLYITGYFNNTVNFDSYPITSQSTENGFIVKLDNNGNALWAKSLLSSNSVFLSSMALASDNEIYFSGYFYAAADLDLDPATSESISPASSIDAFLIKCDSNGVRTWINITSSSTYTFIEDIDVDSNSDLIVCGNFAGTVDLDPTSGVANFTSAGQGDITVAKYSSDGDYIWGKSFEGNADDRLRSNHLTADNSMYMTGEFGGTLDLNPGLGSNNVTSNGGKDAFLIRLDNNGNYVWGNSNGSTAGDIGRNIEIDTSGNVYVSNNRSNSMYLIINDDSISLSANNQARIFTYKLSKDSCKSLVVVIDSASDVSCLVDTGHVFIHSEGGTPPYNYFLDNVQLNTAAIALSENGIYNIEVRDSSQCSSETNVVINKSELPNDFDLDINMMSDVFQPGFYSVSLIDITNLGCLAVSGDIVLRFDSLFEFEDALPYPDMVTADSLVWSFDSLNFDSVSNNFYILSRTSLNAVIGDTMRFDVTANPITNDFDTSNNNKTYLFEIVNSYDPNDKSVYPQGVCDENFTLKNEELTYTVRFQNTGNYKATNISILDTLSDDLDLSTLKVTSASHPYYTELLNNNVVKFSFDNINLPDSSTNELESHGYVIFKIKMNPSILENTLIENNVAIYFDFNPPIITNFTKTTAVTSLPNCSFVSVYNLEENIIQLFPNPVSEVVFVEMQDDKTPLEYILYNRAGVVITQGSLKGLSKFNINLPDVASGVYFLQIKGDLFSQTTKVLISR